MKCIIAGSRTITSYSEVARAILNSDWIDDITQVVSGRAKGVDRLGEQWAKAHGIPIQPFEVTKDEWKVFGSFAGRRRNRQMAEYADLCICVWDGESRGTKSMINLAREYGVPVFIRQVKL